MQPRSASGRRRPSLPPAQPPLHWSAPPAPPERSPVQQLPPVQQAAHAPLAQLSHGQRHRLLQLARLHVLRLRQAHCGAGERGEKCLSSSEPAGCRPARARIDSTWLAPLQAAARIQGWPARRRRAPLPQPCGRAPMYSAMKEASALTTSSRSTKTYSPVCSVTAHAAQQPGERRQVGASGEQRAWAAAGQRAGTGHARGEVRAPAHMLMRQHGRMRHAQSIPAAIEWHGHPAWCLPKHWASQASPRSSPFSFSSHQSWDSTSPPSPPPSAPPAAAAAAAPPPWCCPCCCCCCCCSCCERASSAANSGCWNWRSSAE